MRQTRLVNWRVEVEPDNWPSRRESDRDRRDRQESDCRKIAAAIKRHVDGIEEPRVLFDREETCSSCGSKWTEDSELFNGGCCDADMANEPAALPRVPEQGEKL